MRIGISFSVQFFPRTLALEPSSDFSCFNTGSVTSLSVGKVRSFVVSQATSSTEGSGEYGSASGCSGWSLWSIGPFSPANFGSSISRTLMDLRLADGGLFSECGADFGGIVALAIKFDRRISVEQISRICSAQRKFDRPDEILDLRFVRLELLFDYSAIKFVLSCPRIFENLIDWNCP